MKAIQCKFSNSTRPNGSDELELHKLYTKLATSETFGEPVTRLVLVVVLSLMRPNILVSCPNTWFLVPTAVFLKPGKPLDSSLSFSEPLFYLGT